MTNYNKYSSKNKPTAAEIEANTVVDDVAVLVDDNIQEEIVEVSDVDTETKKPTTNYGIVTAPLLNFRAAPKNDARILDTIQHGATVEITKEVSGSDWYKINYNGINGFVMKSYVEKMM